MSNATTMTGGRVKVLVDSEVVAVFDSCTYTTNIGYEPVYTLGKMGAQEITPTYYDAVIVNCSGYRVFKNGIHTKPKFPTLASLKQVQEVTLEIHDRQNPGGDPIMQVVRCVPTNAQNGFQIRASSRFQITYVGTALVDEDTAGDAETDAVEFPTA